jgi:cytochrome c-type biogenesis protein CcmF
LPFGQSLAWKRGDLLGVAQRLAAAIGLAIAAALILAAWHWGGPVLAPLGAGLGFFLILGSVSEIVSRSWPSGISITRALRRAAGLPRQAFGSALAHAGLGLSVIGIAATAWHVEAIGLMQAGESRNLAGYVVTLEKLFHQRGPNWRETAALFSVSEAGRAKGEVVSTKRVFNVRGTPTTQVGLLTLGFSQIYASLGDAGPDGRIGVRLYFKPLVLLIWLGALVMAAGGALSLSDRRLRIGLPARARIATGERPAAAAE